MNNKIHSITSELETKVGQLFRAHDSHPAVFVPFKLANFNECVVTATPFIRHGLRMITRINAVRRAIVSEGLIAAIFRQLIPVLVDLEEADIIYHSLNCTPTLSIPFSTLV